MGLESGIDILTFNCGSFGTCDENLVGLTDDNKVVRGNTFDLVTKIVEDDGTAPAVVCTQECGSFNFELAPWYKKPIGTDENITIETEDGRDAKRGVATYAKNGFCVEPPSSYVGPPLEFVTTVHPWTKHTKKGRQQKKLCVMSAYRNCNKCIPRASRASLQDYRRYVKHQKEALRLIGVRDMVIVGDFNDQNFRMSGYKELTHEKFYHKANPTAGKKKIDKIFTNCPDIKIKRVYNLTHTKTILKQS